MSLTIRLRRLSPTHHEFAYVREDGSGEAVKLETKSLLLHDLTGCQARMKKGGLAAVSKGELVTLMRPLELSAIAKANVPVT